ncbi:putative quinol monooxygenase [Pelagicoccus sp. SDUM812002]|uniref:putative quinol monooxygenase n=1 Tax=Pelagicoccus sp. SDUM812002 TaxID=3041266 RepID=UPI00280C8F8A|nr:putative quinol monooxygenase [Pelagicoccus sp. SDUM812002]MDQ8185372.1 putative quinol monooxygenase [Pelagicoccus sp. SDUM812002]
MYGIIGKMISTEGSRDTLINILLEGTKDMPGCINYVISKDTCDQNALWITEVWKDKESHEASLSLPSVQEAISKGKPLIAGFADRHVIEPIGGQGI